jgi:hypothetical protein
VSLKQFRIRWKVGIYVRGRRMRTDEKKEKKKLSIEQDQ